MKGVTWRVASGHTSLAQAWWLECHWVCISSLLVATTRAPLLGLRHTGFVHQPVGGYVGHFHFWLLGAKHL